MSEALFWTLVLVIVLAAVVTAYVAPLAVAFAIPSAVTLGFMHGRGTQGDPR